MFDLAERIRGLGRRELVWGRCGRSHAIEPNTPSVRLLTSKAEVTLVMPSKIEWGAAYGMVLYSAKAMLQGQSADVFAMIRENL